jgi:hypothetical protein
MSISTEYGLPEPDLTETERREQQIRDLHDSVLGDLLRLRAERDDLNSRIKVLVGEEDRLSRMVRILDRAHKDPEPPDEPDE